MARKWPTTPKSLGALMAGRPLFLEFDQDTFEKACAYLEIAPAEIVILVEKAWASLSEIEEQRNRTTPNIVVKALTKHPIPPLSSLDVLNAYAMKLDDLFPPELVAEKKSEQVQPMQATRREAEFMHI